MQSKSKRMRWTPCACALRKNGTGARRTQNPSSCDDYRPHQGNSVVAVVEVAASGVADLRLHVTPVVVSSAPDLEQWPSMSRGATARQDEVGAESHPAAGTRGVVRRHLLGVALRRLPALAPVSREVHARDAVAGAAGVGDALHRDRGGVRLDRGARQRRQDHRIHRQLLQGCLRLGVLVVLLIPAGCALRTNGDPRDPLDVARPRDAREQGAHGEAVVRRQRGAVHLRGQEAVVGRVHDVRQRGRGGVAVQALEGHVEALQRLRSAAPALSGLREDLPEEVAQPDSAPGRVAHQPEPNVLEGPAHEAAPPDAVGGDVVLAAVAGALQDRDHACRSAPSADLLQAQRRHVLAPQAERDRVIAGLLRGHLRNRGVVPHEEGLVGREVRGRYAGGPRLGNVGHLAVPARVLAVRLAACLHPLVAPNAPACARLLVSAVGGELRQPPNAQLGECVPHFRRHMVLHPVRPEAINRSTNTLKDERTSWVFFDVSGHIIDPIAVGHPHGPIWTLAIVRSNLCCGEHWLLRPRAGAWPARPAQLAARALVKPTPT
mmetsp:Transcript_25107/g.74925  ORF Transcript_25107/g.74925 Transcript_25107/m.74925 type:complete len:548 (+) Transcript_25107:123-1766(+)